MSIRHLRIFIMVASLKNMSAAAEKLFITQPSVSQAIKEIEHYYGVKLFERLSKKLYLTESGEYLLRYATHIVQSFDEMETMMKNKSDNIALRIGASITVGSCLLNHILDDLEEENNKITTQIYVRNTKEIEKMLLDSELDVALVEGTVTSKDLISKPVYQDKLIMVVGKGHKFYNRDEISIEELQGEAIISREEGSGSKTIFDNILKSNQIEVDIKWSSTDTGAIKDAVLESRGLAVLSRLMVERELKKGTLHEVSLKEVSMFREIFVVYHKNKFMSKSLKCFLEIL
ncbi:MULTISPECIES: LysR family transcriptional regulator [Turicibacter]|uniref:LysR family transcriptional regulator n=4 Tax=Turicibacter sanguinis TaxID=154288 RepID=A0A9X4XK33_9FIRM|nr:MULTISPECIES: LysR family transcriptional regulator [Turicibacter]EFF65202.1 LysR substrate binding domain family protein [Turicibacter sanguinis PC909]EGC93267.1 LysR substrate binding domain protein [Turicibacter sp. HGF1]MBP3903994.1 LysR family transcriptional regulator [Turicibacter sp.]MCU7190938.1 LysR family transcriptional regulator [Turicibacter sanguinis]MCU7211045.1 LysR family transcriptional regulator [Turicibacter sanguinis]